MKPPGPIAIKAAVDALKNVGVKEGPIKNRGKYVDVYLRHSGVCPSDPDTPGPPWCAYFVQYRLDAASMAKYGNTVKEIVRSGYTPDWAKWGKDRGLWVDAKNKPAAVQKGDLALFFIPDMDRIAHIGIVVDTFERGVITVEGNTGPDGDRDGDGVYRKERDWVELGATGGFVRLPF